MPAVINVCNPFRKRLNSWIEFELSRVPKKGEDTIKCFNEDLSRLRVKRRKIMIATNTVNFMTVKCAGVADSLKQLRIKLQTFRSSNKNFIILRQKAFFQSIGQMLYWKLSSRRKQLKGLIINNLPEYLLREQYNDLRSFLLYWNWKIQFLKLP